MNIVFIGASKFGLHCLEACTEIPEVNVVGVVTVPHTFSILYRPSGVTNVLHADVAAIAMDQNIPVPAKSWESCGTGLRYWLHRLKWD